MCVIFCAFANAIFKQVGLEKNDPLIVAMYLGIAYCLMMGQILFPFISTGLTLVMTYSAMFPNNPIDFVPYLIYMIIVGIAMVTVYTALMKFVFRIDASKIASFKTEGGAPKATREQKIGLILFVIFILLMLGHSLPLGPVKHFLEKFGLIGIVLLMSCVVALMKKSDGTPLIDLERAFHMCNWGQVTMVGYIMVCSQYMMGADAGISAAMAKLIMPFMALPPIVFLAVALAIGVVLTNVANNMIVCILLMPFLVNFGSMIGMPPTGMVALLFFMSQFAIATPAASPVTAVAMTQEMADPGVMTKFALKIIPFLFIFGIAIGWPVANIVF
jgi:di/tricarboxylate transporter